MRWPAGLVAPLLLAVVASGDLPIEPGVGHLVIEPRHAGRRLESGAPVPAIVRLSTRDRDTTRVLRARLVDGTIELRDLDTDVYRYIRLVIDLDPSNPIGMAGDHVATAKGAWALRRDGETVRTIVRTQQVMRLSQPQACHETSTTARP